MLTQHDVTVTLGWQDSTWIYNSTQLQVDLVVEWIPTFCLLQGLFQ